MSCVRERRIIAETKSEAARVPPTESPPRSLSWIRRTWSSRRNTKTVRSGIATASKVFFHKRNHNLSIFRVKAGSQHDRSKDCDSYAAANDQADGHDRNPVRSDQI